MIHMFTPDATCTASAASSRAYLADQVGQCVGAYTMTVEVGTEPRGE
jgi:hypothetical protein